MNKIKVETAKVLNELDIPRNIMGYKVIQIVVNILVENPMYLYQLHNDLYPRASQEFLAEPKNIERHIRHVIEKANKKSELWLKWFKRPHATNGEFLAALVEHLEINGLIQKEE